MSQKNAVILIYLPAPGYKFCTDLHLITPKIQFSHYLVEPKLNSSKVNLLRFFDCYVKILNEFLFYGHFKIKLYHIDFIISFEQINELQLVLKNIVRVHI